MPFRHTILPFIVVLASCASVHGPQGSSLFVQTRLLVSNPTQYPLRVYAARSPDGPGQRLGRLAIGGQGAYRLPYVGDVFFRLVRLNGRVVRARAHVAPGDVVEIEPNLAWSMLFVTIYSRP